MVNKSKSNFQEVMEKETSITEIEEIEEDTITEEGIVIEEMVVSEETTEEVIEEDPEEILVIDQRDVSIVVKKVTLPEIALNVIYPLIF